MAKSHSKHQPKQTGQEPLTKSRSARLDASGVDVARRRIPVWLLAGLLAVVTVILFWPAMHCVFINYDDPDYVTENSHVQDGLSWEGLKWAFGNTKQAGYWAPVMWLSHQLACQWFGLNPWGHHLINVLLHAASTALLFLALRRMTGATWRSLMVAALFGWHPLRVESVAWVTERKDVLSAFFGMLTLLCYARYAQNSEVRSRKSEASFPFSSSFLHAPGYWLALLFYALGLMSKAMLVTLPFVLLLLDYWPLGRFSMGDLRGTNFRSFPSLVTRHSSLLLEKIPFFALAAAGSVVTYAAQQHEGAVATFADLPLGARAGNALISYGRYLGKLFWPVDLAVFYPHPGHWPMVQVLLAGGLLVAITVVVLMQRSRYPFMLMGWLWFVGTLLPVIQLVQSGGQAMADRFSYVPSVGVLILVVWGTHELTRNWRYQRWALTVVGAAASILCMAVTRHQLGYWRDSEALFQHALAVTNNNYTAYNGLGNAFLNQGRYDEAIAQYQETLRLKADEEAVNNIGKALFNQGHLDAAIAQYQAAIHLNRNFADAYNNLGTALDRKGQTDQAIVQYQTAIRLKPNNAGFHNNLGISLERNGQTGEAVREYQGAIRLDPNFATACNNLGFLWASRGENLEAAHALIEKAVRLQPKNAAFLDSLGWVLFKLNRPREALDYQLQAIENSPRPNPSLYDHLGDVYAALNQREQAAGAWRQSLAIEPNPKIEMKLDHLASH